ncbi:MULTISPECIES: phospholipase domain-containing protein [unclassified Streptomyces]|uniref:phospholipase domain-containing protein n=1 Tax=Streptomyces sp. NBC_01669 TaxID=2975909 RepID=UPI002B1CAD18|nr:MULTISPECIES: phospholipase domain-containing protein [unclassified Streptomyces]
MSLIPWPCSRSWAPNRFLRRFTGDATRAGKNLEVAARYAAAPDTGKTAVRFRLSDASTAPVTFTITSNNYRSDDPWTCTVAAVGSAEDRFDAVTGPNGWYDFTVTADADATWSRRYTGHIETGAASISG